MTYYQKCPVCGGRTVVPHGFYPPPPGNLQTPPPNTQECRACSGKGILLITDWSVPTYYPAPPSVPAEPYPWGPVWTAPDTAGTGYIQQELTGFSAQGENV